MQLFDTHAHLDDRSLQEILGPLVLRASEVGVVQIIAVGTTADSSEQSIRLAESYDSVRAAVGIQPNCCHEVKEGDWDRVVAQAEHPQVVAIGETGLDRYWDDVPFPLQQEYFQRHLCLSQETSLPFIVHMRDCETDVLEMLREVRRSGVLSGVMHSFTGSLETAEECVELGMYISFAGMVTFKKSDELRAVAAAVPAERLLIETDSPYLSPHPVRGQRPNEPALIIHTAQCLAEARGITVEQLASDTTANAQRLFQWKRGGVTQRDCLNDTD